MLLKLPQSRAGVVEVSVFFGEADAEEVFAASAAVGAGAEEGTAGYRGYSGGGEEGAGFFGGGGAGEAGRVGEDVVGSGGDGGREAGVGECGDDAFAF